jgi:hypothetical protein
MDIDPFVVSSGAGPEKLLKGSITMTIVGGVVR